MISAIHPMPTPNSPMARMLKSLKFAISYLHCGRDPSLRRFSISKTFIAQEYALSLTSCSQKCNIHHPLASSLLSLYSALSKFLDSFLFQYTLFDLGAWPCIVHECQKHPSTNIAIFMEGKAISILSSPYWTLYRHPCLQSSLLSISSGAVSLDFILAISKDLCVASMANL